MHASERRLACPGEALPSARPPAEVLVGLIKAAFLAELPGLPGLAFRRASQEVVNRT